MCIDDYNLGVMSIDDYLYRYSLMCIDAYNLGVMSIDDYLYGSFLNVF